MAKRISSGQRYGRLTVIRKTERRTSGRIVWECRCDCGNTAYVTSAHLLGGSTTSCGCARSHTNRMDLSGQRFGRLVALSPTDRRMCHSVIWRCQCDCGKIAEIAAISLRNGSTRSCGCLSSEVHRKSSATMQQERRKDLVDGTDIKLLMLPPTSANTSGTTGVSWDKSVRTWKAHITFKGRRYSLGSSRDKAVAIALRKEAEKRIHGEFLKWYYEAYPDRKKD